MKGFAHRVSFLALAAFIATAVLGAAYSLWFENLHASANISTGTLDAKIVCGLPLDNENATWATLYPASPYLNYPASSPLKSIATVSNGSANGDHEWTLTVSGAYPGYMFECGVTITNIGTVPWHLETQSILITSSDGTNITVDCSGAYNSACSDGAPGYHTNTNTIYAETEDVEGCQIHAGHDLSTKLFVGVNEAAHDSATYHVTLKFTVNQWNESAFDSCGTQRTQAAPASNDATATLPTAGAVGPGSEGKRG